MNNNGNDTKRPTTATERSNKRFNLNPMGLRNLKSSLTNQD